MQLLSIIVPVYNVNKYLDKCIQSILSSSYNNIELLLIDDGSTDNSLIICKKWAQTDNRIQVIHQDNSGAGAARNKGLEIAQGDFITFVDSDDYIDQNMYFELIKHFDDDVDIVECDYVLAYDDYAHFKQDNNLIEHFSMKEAMKLHIEDKMFKQLIWNKVYRKSILKNVVFPLGKKIDDEYWTYKAIGNSKNLVHVHKEYYAYRQQNQSVMHSLKISNRLEAIDSKICRHNYIVNYVPELKNISLINLWQSCLYQEQACFLSNQITKEIKDYFKRILLQYPLDLSIVINKKLKLWLFFYMKFNVLTCKIRNLLKIGL